MKSNHESMSSLKDSSGLVLWDEEHSFKNCLCEQGTGWIVELEICGDVEDMACSSRIIGNQC